MAEGLRELGSSGVARATLNLLVVGSILTRPKSAVPERGVYVRVGSSLRRADKELIAELKRFAQGASYDEEPLPDLDSEAIDFRAASECFAPKRKLKGTDLDTLRI